MVDGKDLGQAFEKKEPSKEPKDEFIAFSDSLGRISPSLSEGIRLYNKKQWEKALEEFIAVRIAKLSAEEIAEYHYYLGLCYTKLRRYDEAQLYLEQVTSSPANTLRFQQCRLLLAFVYINTSRHRQAELELRQLQNNGVESPQLYNAMAYAAWVQNRHQVSIELYEKTLKIDADNITAMNSIGFILADTGIDILRGLHFCKKVVEINPQNAAYLDSLGWAYYKSGDSERARICLSRALEIAPDEKEILRHFKIVTGDET
ncbi:MAG: tetratricopeptide repeat protein [Spirochaetes bacterium]|nr:tetratricopeptide repeat protein [Spirochaetota bacterium]